MNKEKRQIEKSELRSGLTVGVGYYTSIADIDADAGKVGSALKLCNTYMQQKSALPEANDFLVEEVLEKLTPPFKGDPKKDEKVDVKDPTGAVTGSKIVNNETEGQRIARFMALGDAGQLPMEYGITGSGAAKSFLQKALNAHGPFYLDSSAPVRTPKAKNPSKFALEAVEKVWAGGAKHITAWTDKLHKAGYAFSTKAEDGTILTADVVKTNMAWAIDKRDDDRRKAEADKEFSAPVK